MSHRPQQDVFVIRHDKAWIGGPGPRPMGDRVTAGRPDDYTANGSSNDVSVIGCRDKAGTKKIRRDGFVGLAPMVIVAGP